MPRPSYFDARYRARLAATAWLTAAAIRPGTLGQANVPASCQTICWIRSGSLVAGMERGQHFGQVFGNILSDETGAEAGGDLAMQPDGGRG